MDPLFSFQNKTILVVGASSGIGQHAARLFASRGAKLLVAARRKGLLDALAKELKAQSFYVDVAQPKTIADMLSQTGPIDVLLNTAGTNVRKSALEHTEEDWDHLMGINLKGSWAISQAVMKHMAQHQTKGKIILISSIFGHMSSPQQTLYSTSKAGIEQLVRSFALEGAHLGIHVNAIAPGYIETELNRDYLKGPAGKAIVERTPLHRLGTLSDLEGALLLLASSASDYITGSIIPVDGGCATRHFLSCQ
jgi:NAD(P)-dependent dehydrogenase (short-subunit alcohol dehydrogenase family)